MMSSFSSANSTPLGRFNPNNPNNSRSSLLKPSYMGADDMPTRGSKRDFDYDANSNDSHSSTKSSDQNDKRRKRKSRWGGSENDKVIIPGMPTMLPANLNPDQERIYLLQLQIEEICRRLRTGDLGIIPNPEDRSPSPEPIYNNEGKRLNTREFRTRKKLEDERHALIQNMFQINPAYKPPADYKPPQQKISEKVLIPQEEYPDINFVGLLIGPRGNTLKSMEKETGAKIIIRGKGSVKEGKIGRKDGQPMPGEDEPLHAFITATTNEAVAKAVNKIKEIIRQGIEVPENQNDLRRMQLRELALLNGTLRESDGPRCTNCGSTVHRSWQCPDKPNVTNNVVCTNCGGTGHIAKDCKEKKSAGMANQSKIDEEYMSLMAELGEGPPLPSKPYISSTASMGPTIGNSLSTPRALLPPPANQQSIAHSQPLLPTPSVPPQSSTANSWARTDTTQSQGLPPIYWNSTGYGLSGASTSPATTANAFAISSDSYSQAYSQTQTTASASPMSWYQQQNMWNPNNSTPSAVPPPPSVSYNPSNSSGFIPGNILEIVRQIPPPPPPPD